MFRLYQMDEAGRPAAYFELWAEPARRRIITHWGAVGESGETGTHRIQFFKSLEQQFERLMAPVRAAGFAPLAETDYTGLTVFFASAEAERVDEAAAEALEDRVNEILGWTGLGVCDDVRLEPGAVALTLLTVNTAMAASLLRETAGEDDALKTYSLDFAE